MAKYDVVIIGAGLGGLECGVILAREGFSVCVLEKNRSVGGCLQTFRRAGHTLDTGMHYAGSLDDGQLLNQYFRYLGVMDGLQIARLDAEAFDTVVLGGDEFEIGMGYERFSENLKSRFPAQCKNIDRFCSLLKEIGSTMGTENLRRGIFSEGAMRYIETSAHDALCEVVSDPLLQNVLAGGSMLYAGDKSDTPLYHYGMTSHSFIESAWRFVGGAGQLADALADQIRLHGGEVITNSEVTRIIVAGDRVSGVKTVGGEVIEARYIISDIHPALTFGLVEPTPRIKKSYLARLRSLANSYGMMSVYLIMKNRTVPYLNRNYYIYADGDCWKTLYDVERNTPRAVFFNMQASVHEQRYAEVVSLLCPVPLEMFSEWENTFSERRGEGYHDLKARLAEKIIEFTARHIPGFRDNIEQIFTTSPLSWRDWTATPRGSAYGIVKDWASPLTTLIPVNTRLDNMLLTGQNLNVHGALGVTVTAAMTCAKLIGTEYLAKKISYA